MFPLRDCPTSGRCQPRISRSEADGLLELLDREQQVTPVAAMVDAALAAGDSDRLIAILGRAVLREDAEFHA